MNILLFELAALRAAGPLTFAIICFCIAYYDFKYYVIPNELVLAGIALRFLCLSKIFESIIGAGIFTFFLALISFLIWLLTKNKIGIGDFKLIFMLCLFTSFENNLVGLFSSLIFGFLTFVLTKKNKFPFAPCIVLGWFCAIIVI